MDFMTHCTKSNRPSKNDLSPSSKYLSYWEIWGFQSYAVRDTFSSNRQRVTYEMITKHQDRQQKAQSTDENASFGGELGHNFILF